MAKMANEKDKRQKEIENIERSCICWNMRTVGDDGKPGELVDFGLFDHDKNVQGKIRPGPQWAQRCFADPEKMIREGVWRKDRGYFRMRWRNGRLRWTDCRGACLGPMAARRKWWGWGLISGGQWIATVLAVGGVLLNNARIRWCFPVWLVSNIICLRYHIGARMWGLAVRDVIFIVLAIAGWFQWGS